MGVRMIELSNAHSAAHTVATYQEAIERYRHGEMHETVALLERALPWLRAAASVVGNAACPPAQLHTFIGRTFRVGDATDALVIGCACYLDNAPQLQVVIWDGKSRNQEWISLAELGEEVTGRAPFGFTKGGTR